MKTALAALALIAAIALIGAIATPYDPTAFAVRLRFGAPSWPHPFGTDEFGRDVLSRVLAGAHLSVAIGSGAMAVSLAAGVPLGLATAWGRGWLTTLVLRAADLLLSLPPILLGLLILAVTPPSLWKTILAVGIVYIPIMLRLVRAVAMGLLREDFVVAARARGEGAASILLREVLPNAWPTIIVESGLRVTFAILLGASLSFLGLGPQPPASEWGLMIAEGRQYLTEAPWIGLAPGLCLCALLLCVNFSGERLRAWLDHA